MENSYCFVLKETCAETANIIRNWLSRFIELREIVLDEKQRSKFLKLVIKESGDCYFQLGSPLEEKRYKGYAIVKSGVDYSNVFPLHGRIGINHDFSEELIEISKNTNNPILYSWQEHSTIGNAVFKSGTLIKTISYDTHEPLYTVDGKEFKPNSRRAGSSRIYDSSPEAKTIIPPEFHEYLNRELAATEEFALKRGQIIVYLRKDIADIAEFFRKTEESFIRPQRQFKLISFMLILLVLFLLVVFFIKPR